MKFTEKEHNYIESEEEREEGHEDTRYKNFECDHPLGCNLGIDVAGQQSDPKLSRAAVFGRCPFFMVMTENRKNTAKVVLDNESEDEAEE